MFHHRAGDMMIPDCVGKEIAEALLLESDESTASLSETSIDREAFDSTVLGRLAFDNTDRFDRALSASNTSTAIPPPPPGFDQQSTLRQQQQSNKRAPNLFAARRCVALDCEMVGVGPEGKRSVLARVSVVDYFGNCLLDTLVKVEERVTDYRTHVTGITAIDLSSKKALPYAACRKKVISLIRNKILVGHGLDNDLAVLGIVHPWYNIRDTAKFYPYQKKNRFGLPCPRRLRDLARMHLGLIIQKPDRPHCPVEDACAAMALYRRNEVHWDCSIDQSRHGVFVGGFGYHPASMGYNPRHSMP